MNDLEKAKEIANSYEDDECDSFDIFTACVGMAQWKDEQYNEEKKELLGLVNMLSVDEHNQTIIEDLKALLQ